MILIGSHATSTWGRPIPIKLSHAAWGIVTLVAACGEFGGADERMPEGAGSIADGGTETDSGAAPAVGSEHHGIVISAGDGTKPLFVIQGRSVAVPIKLVRSQSTSGAVTITVAKLPPGMSADPLTIAPGQSDAQLTLRATPATVQGPVTLDVTGIEAADRSMATVKLSAFVRGRPGALDTTFGTGGVIKNVFGAPTSFANDAKVLQNGAVIVAGRRTNNLALVRFTAAGVLDTTFTGGGRTNLSSSQGELFVDVVEGKVPSDGFVYAASRAAVTGVLFRTSLDGVPNPAFDGDGQAPLNLSRGNFQMNQVLALPDGKALVLTSHFGTVKAAVVSRWKADGTLDDTYGVGGVCELTGEGTGSDAAGVGGMLMRAGGGVQVTIGVASGGSIVKACTAGGLLDTTLGAAPNHFVTVLGAAQTARYFDGGVVGLSATSWSRYNASFVGDTGVGSFGAVAVTPITQATSLLTQPDGSILVAGDSGDTGVFTVVRFKSTGLRDLDFGDQSVAKIPISTNSALASKLVAQPDGRILVLGRQDDDFDGVVARIWN